MSKAKRLISPALFWCVTLCASCAWANSGLDSLGSVLVYGFLAAVALLIFLCAFGLSSLLFLWRSWQLLSPQTSAQRPLTWGYGLLSCLTMVGALGVFFIGIVLLDGVVEGLATVRAIEGDPPLSMYIWRIVPGVVSILIALFHVFVLALTLYRKLAKSASTLSAQA